MTFRIKKEVTWEISLRKVDDGAIELWINDHSYGYFDDKGGLILFNVQNVENPPPLDKFGFLKIAHEDMYRPTTSMRTVELVYKDPKGGNDDSRP